MDKLNEVFKNFDINDYQFYGHKDPKVNIILTAWATHFNKAYPRGLCKREFDARLKQIYNVWKSKQDGKPDKLTTVVKSIDLDILKKQADELGLKYHPAIGAKKLEEKIRKVTK